MGQDRPRSSSLSQAQYLPCYPQRAGLLQSQWCGCQDQGMAIAGRMLSTWDGGRHTWKKRVTKVSTLAGTVKNRLRVRPETWLPMIAPANRAISAVSRSKNALAKSRRVARVSRADTAGEKRRTSSQSCSVIGPSPPLAAQISLLKYAALALTKLACRRSWTVRLTL